MNKLILITMVLFTACSFTQVTIAVKAIEIASDLVTILEYFDKSLNSFQSSINKAEEKLNSIGLSTEERAISWEADWEKTSHCLMEVKQDYLKVERHVDLYFKALNNEANEISSDELRSEELKKNEILSKKWSDVKQRFKNQMALATKIEQDGRDIKQVLILAAMRKKVDGRIDYIMGLHSKVSEISNELIGLIIETRLMLGLKVRQTIKITTENIGIEMIRVPSGTFQMGSNNGESDEKPIHTVHIHSFDISKTEVTVGQYRKCVRAGWCTEPVGGNKDDCNWRKRGRENHPINCVDWTQARTFAKWVGEDFDLPSEAEWEYAAKGGENLKYAGANNHNEVGWDASNTNKAGTKAVGTKRANGYGLYDMSGNVWEWVLDEWHDSYSRAPSNGSQAWGDVPICKQKCDKGLVRRVLRGGSWGSSSYYLRVVERGYHSPDYHDDYLGFRLRRSRPSN